MKKNKQNQAQPKQEVPRAGEASPQAPPVNIGMLFQRLGEKDYIIGQLQQQLMALQQRLAAITRDNDGDKH